MIFETSIAISHTVNFILLFTMIAVLYNYDHKFINVEILVKIKSKKIRIIKRKFVATLDFLAIMRYVNLRS